MEAAAAQLEARGLPPPSGLEGPELPLCVRHLWDWWQELHLARGSSGFGPVPLSWSDIDAWARLTGARPSPPELRAIMALDRAIVSVLIEKKPPSPQ